MLLNVSWSLKKLSRKFKIFSNKRRWKYNIPESLGYPEGDSKKKIYSNVGLP